MVTGILILLGLAGIAIVVIAAAVAAASRRNASDNGGEKNMVKTLFHYLVLFATLMMTIGGSVSVFMALADIITPTPYYQSFESYKEMMRSPKAADGEPSAQAPLSDDELRARYDAIVEEERKNEQTRAINRLIKSLGWIVIPLPVFLYYQRRLKQA
jgi:hypothetical protein